MIRSGPKEILEVATEEFANPGFRGRPSRRDRGRTRTTKRMIYYYFGSKERLYVAVLEKAYEDIRVTEQNVDVESLDPVTAIRQLAEFTFDRHEANPDVQSSGQSREHAGGEFVTAAAAFPVSTDPIIKMLKQVARAWSRRGRLQARHRRAWTCTC